MSSLPKKRSAVSIGIDEILAKFDKDHSLISRSNSLPLMDWVWDSPGDVEYAYSDHRFDGVLHVFHKEWHGIRAAAGSLPGRKLAIPETSLSDVQQGVLALEIREANPSRIVFHGFSTNMGMLVRSLRDYGFSQKLFLVFHGSPAQWWDEVERRLALDMIGLAQAGSFKRIHIMKKGMEVPGAPVYEPILYNVSPNHSGKFGDCSRRERVTAFVPGWGNWIKNVLGSAYGASLSEKIEDVWIFAENTQLPEPLNEKLVFLRPVNREETFKRYLSAHLTLNVSLIDCHPMVNVESQSLGRPCIRPNLNLDHYEDHEYVKLVSVEHNNSPAAIRDAVDRTLRIPEAELRELIFDYQSKIDTLSIGRYLEFLEI